MTGTERRDQCPMTAAQRQQLTRLCGRLGFPGLEDRDALLLGALLVLADWLPDPWVRAAAIRAALDDQRGRTP